jgi:hypothetical protein
MELLAFLRWLRRHPIAVGLGVLIAAAAAFMSVQGPSHTFATASQRLVLDTPKSQLLNADPLGADTLTWRAAVLSEMTATRPLKDRITRDMGVPSRSLGVTSMNLTDPAVESALTVAAQEAEAEAGARYLVAVSFDERFPLITVATRAPDRHAAARLAAVTTAALSTATTAPPGTGAPQGLVVESIGQPRTKTVVDGPHRLTAIVVFAVLLSVWCVGIALLSRVRNVLAPPPRAAAPPPWTELAPGSDLSR